MGNINTVNNKKMKKRGLVFTFISFLLFGLSTVKLAEYGFIMSELSSMSLDFFPILWYILAVLSFLFINFPVYLKMLGKVDKLEDLARKVRMSLLDVFKSEKDLKTFEKCQIIPFIVLLFASILFPFVVMTLSGLIFSEYNSNFLFISSTILSVYFLLLMSIYVYRMTVISALLNRCKPFIQYANRNLNRE